MAALDPIRIEGKELIAAARREDDTRSELRGTVRSDALIRIGRIEGIQPPIRTRNDILTLTVRGDEAIATVRQYFLAQAAEPAGRASARGDRWHAARDVEAHAPRVETRLHRRGTRSHAPGRRRELSCIRSSNCPSWTASAGNSTSTEAATTSQFLQAFRHVDDKSAQFSRCLRHVLHAVKSALATNSLQTYRIAQGHASDGRSPAVATRVEIMKRALGRRALTKAERASARPKVPGSGGGGGGRAEDDGVEGGVRGGRRADGPRCTAARPAATR